jgi:ribosomal protein L11 methyltransferase
MWREKEFFLKIFLPHTRSFKQEKLRIEEALAQLPGNNQFVINERLLKQEDWFAYIKQQFTILEVGEKLLIKATWADTPPSSNRIVIELDPGYAFGTGLHPTTRLCLIHLERKLQPGMSILDLGTGSGILSIAAAKLGAASVLALDTDANAVYAARIISGLIPQLTQYVKRYFSRELDLPGHSTWWRQYHRPAIASLSSAFSKS